MKIWLLGVVAGLTMFTVACSAEPPATPSAEPTESDDAEGASADTARKVDIGGRELFISCRGTGEPTVVLEAGFGGDSRVWPRAVLLDPLEEMTRTCVYDRAGLGVSDPAVPHTLDRSAEDLHDLLRASGEQSPFVLVGHSLGGSIARLYAGRYPNDVAGLMLIDSPHESFVRRARPLLSPRQKALLEVPADNVEKLDVPASERIIEGEVGGAGALGDVPLVVLSRSGSNDSVPFRNVRGFEDLWQRTQSELAGLSTKHRHVIAKRSGHFIQGEQPALIVKWVKWLVNEANRG